MSMTVVQARDDLLSKLGIPWASATDQDKQDVVVAINGAMQILQTAGEDWFTKQQVTIAMTAGTGIYRLSRNLQAVVGDAMWNDEKPLRALESRGQYMQFGRIFNGSATYGPGSGVPSAYWVENSKEGSTGDINLQEIWMAPTPAASGTFSVEAVVDATAYTVADMTSTAELPVAQNYAETIFLPIARLLITRSEKFSRPDLLPRLQQDYQTALSRLGFQGGFPNSQEPKPPREVTG